MKYEHLEDLLKELWWIPFITFYIDKNSLVLSCQLFAYLISMKTTND